MSALNTHIPHILELSPRAKQEFLDSFDFIFFDCDGVIWLVVGSIPNVEEAVNMLKDAGKKCKFVSNNSIRTDAEYTEKFRKLGIREVMPDDVLHPAKAMVRYVKKYLPADSKIFSICDANANELFRKNDLDVETLEIQEHLTPALLMEKVNLRGRKVRAVLCDININLNFAQMVRASLYLQQNEDCELIVGGSDPFIPVTADLTIIGTSQFVDLLIQQTKKEPVILGKPGKALCQLLKEIYNIGDTKRVLFVGDALKFDIGFAKQCGFQTLLVLSGVSTKEDMLNAPLENRPDFYADGVIDFIKFFKELRN